MRQPPPSSGTSGGRASLPGGRRGPSPTCRSAPRPRARQEQRLANKQRNEDQGAAGRPDPDRGGNVAPGPAVIMGENRARHAGFAAPHRRRDLPSDFEQPRGYLCHMTHRSLLRAVIYTRLSSHRGDADPSTSPARRVATCRAYVEAKGWAIATHIGKEGVIADLDVSGERQRATSQPAWPGHTT